MKYFIIYLLIAFFSLNQESICQNKWTDNIKKVKESSFQSILDTAKVTGSVLVYDPQLKTLYSNDFERCEKGFLPASTFKIVNSIISLETGVVENDSTIFIWNSQKRNLAIWEKDLSFKEAFQLSCVPCYQDIAKIIGAKRMNEYLKKLNYGHMIVDSTTIDNFWLEGESKITIYEQIDFLKRYYFSELPISKRTENILRRLMLIEENKNYKFSGKTGWAIRNGNNIGWFVGFLEVNSKVYFIVTNIDPKQDFNMDLFPKIRTQLSMKAFKKLKLIE